MKYIYDNRSVIKLMSFDTIKGWANKLHISPATVQRLSVGKEPDLATYFKLCAYLTTVVLPLTKRDTGPGIELITEERAVSTT